MEYTSGRDPAAAEPRVRLDGRGLSTFRLAVMAMRVPWKDVVRAAPMVLRAADRLLRRDASALDRYDSTPTLGSLEERVERLEAASIAHADVVREVAGQVDQLSRALRSLAIQAVVAIALAAAALGVSIVALIRTLVVVP